MSLNSMDECWVSELVKDYHHKLGFVLPLDPVLGRLDGGSRGLLA